MFPIRWDCHSFLYSTYILQAADPHQLRPIFMSKAFVPFDISQRTVVSGGHLGSNCWVPEVMTVNGHAEEFVHLKKNDRLLCMAIGITGSTYPGKSVSLFEYISHLRDKKVDGMIAMSLAQDDPMSEQANFVVPGKGREKYFKNATSRM